MADFRTQFVDFNTRLDNLLDVVIAHTDMEITCRLEENKPDGLDHQWLKMELVKQGKTLNKTKIVTRKKVDWTKTRAVLQKVIWLTEDTTHGINSNNNLTKRTEQLIKSTILFRPQAYTL